MPETGAPCSQCMPNWRSFTSWTERQRQDRQTHQQNLQSISTPPSFLRFRPVHSQVPQQRIPKLSVLEHGCHPQHLQVCPVPCCPSHHGKKAQIWTTKQGLTTHVEMHSTWPLQGQVLDQWLADSSLHICPVCSSHLLQDWTMLPQMLSCLQQSCVPVPGTICTPQRASPERNPFFLGPTPNTHPQSRRGSLGPLPSGRPEKKANFLTPVPPCWMNHRLPTLRKSPRRCEPVKEAPPDSFGLPRRNLSITLVQDSLLSFAPDSTAGPRPQHTTGDELMRALHAVVRITAGGNIPGPSVS